ncbi:seminal plasma protein PDC-109-like [Crotalus tigris]|uniref:seminal plasma protein PDC-109-like n=1 Tax=Crotalus tigris TaxID=88082 RepID=UPI00192FAF74|nr:seminal plasma protein PDC-109-like [Crotalus tigris]
MKLWLGCHVELCADITPHSCVFPFIYQGKSYSSCTEVDSLNHSWCATTSNYDKSPQWKYCAIKSLTYLYFWGEFSVLIFSSFSILVPRPCVFPFIYQGKSYSSCIEVDSLNHPWCATTANYDKSPQWKYCDTKGLTYLHFWVTLFSRVRRSNNCYF